MDSDTEKREKHLQTFRSLVVERTNKLNVAWIQIEEGAGAPETPADLLGTLHTIKGDAGLLGFSAVVDVAHGIEDLFGRIMASGQPPDQDTGQTILDAFDMVVTLAARAPDDPAPEAKDMLATLAQRAMQFSPRPAADDAMPDPPPADNRGGPPSEEPPPRPPPRGSVSYSVRINPRQLDRMRDIIGELLLARTRLATSAESLQRQRHGLTDAGGSLAAGRGGTGAEVLRSIESELRDDVLRISNLVTSLDEITRELRMVAVSVLFDRYPLAVRNIGRELGRQVSLVCRGEAALADRDVLEALDDPLLHLVRNALDHGIEPPAVRRAAGKEPTGTLTLTARVASDSLQVEISDDGAGIDVEQVRALAVERSVVDATTARTLSERQVLQCLFLAGMSTRKAVTSFSGRGMGLDVVQRSVRTLGGTVEVSTVQGKGTTFHLTVPIRAAISSVLLFRVGNGWYALPTSALVGLAEIDDLSWVDSIDGPAVRYEGAIVPLIALEQVLGEAGSEADSEAAAERTARAIIARHGDRLIALGGSHHHLQREAVLKSVSTLMRDDKLIMAGLGLEDGSVALVLNVGEVLKLARGAAALGELPSAAQSEPEPPPTRHTVLVAEDSPIVRDLVAESLRAHGLDVVEAPDGQAALERLEQYSNIALLVTDVEMPRLDGLGLITKMRARGGRRIPAIVVSTRGSDADKRAAVEVGADAYLVKSDFSREGLWAMVSRFLGRA